jgi:hypothetical protein
MNLIVNFCKPIVQETVGIFPRPLDALGLLFVASAQVLHTSYAKVCATHLQLQELGLRQISDGL